MRDLAQRKKSEFRYCEKLSNGQLLNVYFWRLKAVVFDEHVFVWNVGVVISKNRKEANHWFLRDSKKKKEISTGDCGLEGLKMAKDLILEFQHQLKQNEYLFVAHSDEKRKRAYKWLLRYGFKEFFKGDEFHNYGIANPFYWEWVDDE